MCAQPLVTVQRQKIKTSIGDLSQDYRYTERATYLSETLAGRIVLSHSGARSDDKPTGGELDQLHLRKIDLADEILVLNVGGYLGDRTKNEVAYARRNGKKVRWLEGTEPV